MFCQSQAYPTENKPEKVRLFWLFSISKKSPMCSKKSEFQNLASKKPNWQPATQELRMRVKYARKRSIFYVQKSRKLSFPFPLLRHYQMPECFYVKNCFFELVQQFYHAT